MSNPNLVKTIAAEPCLEPGKDPIIRLNCLELASRLGESDPTQVVYAANLYLKFVGGA